jgi:hypothetical protein
MIKHDSMVSQKFDKAPEELQFCTNVDQMTAGFEKNLLKNFFVLRRLMDLPNDTSMLTQDQSLPSKWSQNDFIALPKERKYQNCILWLKSPNDAQELQLPEAEGMPDSQILLKLVIMGDPTWLCLFKPDLSDRATVKGSLRIKLLIENI